MLLEKYRIRSKKTILGLVLVLIFFAAYSDQSFEPQNIDELRKIANSKADILPPKAFTTDGCSLWPNSIFGKDLAHICILHDMEYWKGGSSDDRKTADRVLRAHVNLKAPFMGDVMYVWIRVFGHQAVYSPWRWGYGFEYPYTY